MDILMTSEPLHVLLAFVVGCALGPWLEVIPPAICHVWRYRRQNRRP
jgi:hypothetical protein